MPTKEPVIDLDTLLGMIVTEKMPTKEVKLFGRKWTINCDLNSFSMAQIAGGDASGLAKFLTNLVAEDQQEDFVKAMSEAKGLNGEKLGELLGKLIEVAAERPTVGPSPSPTTAKRRTSTLRSVGN